MERKGNVSTFILLGFLLAALGISTYLLLSYQPTTPVALDSYSADFEMEIFSNGTQFYPNMRYRDRNISYGIEKECSPKQKDNAIRAFSIIEKRSVLEFYRDDNEGEIMIVCSQDLGAPESEKEGFFVAGEGGPSRVIDNVNYFVIFSGKISLYREDSCARPQIALHEILHAFGFDHNNNTGSIMFPVTACNQIIDNYIIDEINELYRDDSNVDLAIENVSLTKKGRFLDFDIIIANLGLKNSENSTLFIFEDDDLDEIGKFYLNEIKIGTRQILTVQNLRYSGRAEKIIFRVNPIEKEELSKDNNKVELIAVTE